MGPRNGVPATPASRGAPRGDDKPDESDALFLVPPRGPALVEKCLDTFTPLGRGARFSDAASGRSLERVVDPTNRGLRQEPFSGRWCRGGSRVRGGRTAT